MPVEMTMGKLLNDKSISFTSGSDGCYVKYDEPINEDLTLIIALHLSCCLHSVYIQHVHSFKLQNAIILCDNVAAF